MEWFFYFNFSCVQRNGSGLTAIDLNVRATVHYGIPSTASILAVDPIQRLLAIGTLWVSFDFYALNMDRSLLGQLLSKALTLFWLIRHFLVHKHNKILTPDMLLWKQWVIESWSFQFLEFSSALNFPHYTPVKVEEAREKVKACQNHIFTKR